MTSYRSTYITDNNIQSHTCGKSDVLEPPLPKSWLHSCFLLVLDLKGSGMKAHFHNQMCLVQMFEVSCGGCDLTLSTQLLAELQRGLAAPDLSQSKPLYDCRDLRIFNWLPTHL